MWNMDETDLVSYYKSKAEEWIFRPKLQNVLIEDDEILDLDTLDLNNKDTWLYSSSNKPFLDNADGTQEDGIDGGDEELAKEFQSPEQIESSYYDTADHLSSLSMDSPLSLLNSSDFRHIPFLNSIDEMSNSTVENLLRETPKSNLLKKVLSNNLSGRDTFIKRTSVGSSDDDFTFKKPVERTYILHSVENKLSSLTDAEVFKNVQNRDVRHADGETKDHEGDKEEDQKFVSRVARVTSTKKLTPHKMHAEGARFGVAAAGEDAKTIENDENIFRKLPAWHSTPQSEDGTNRAAAVAKKTFSLCQPSPVLINRYLKYNKDRLPNDEFDEANRSGMNVTYSKDHIDVPRVDVDASENLVVARKTPLSSTFSKSDDVLNCGIRDENLESTCHLTIEDDAASSTSESSLSSMGAKHTLSIKQVQKMAEQQELSLKKHLHSRYYAGSSKSSEVSSSNESVSACGVLNSSNEDQLHRSTIVPPKAFVKNKKLENQNLIYSKGPLLHSRIGIDNNHSSSVSKLEFGTKSTLNETVTKTTEKKIGDVFKSKLSIVHTASSNARQNSKDQKQQNRKLSIAVPKRMVPNIQGEEEIVSVKEIKSKESNEVKECSDVKISSTNTASPVSHIPRPSSRIPMLRTSVSCNRYNKK